MTDRLTIADCRVGMRVECVDASNAFGVLEAGRRYFVTSIDGKVIGIDDLGWVLPSRFTPADPAPQPAMTAELVAALRVWRTGWIGAESVADDDAKALFAAIERAGILAEPAPRVTLPAMYLGAEAFEEQQP